jgi:hypothetical protein
MDDGWEWVDELIFTKQEAQIELPEDLYILFLRKNPKLGELVERFECDLIY